MKYTIARTEQKPLPQGQWDDPIWRQAETAWIDSFHPQSSGHHPKTAVKVLYDPENLYVRFRVQDQYVRARYTAYQDPVWQDSCVEFFVMPHEKGYFNFEMNCIGTLLLYYIEDARRTATGFRKYAPVPADLVRDLTVLHSLPAEIEGELAMPVTWELAYNIPFALFEAYLQPLDASPPGRGRGGFSMKISAGTQWRGNFYKCGDHTSHPHWASWAPIGDDLNFHQPACFGILEFGA